MIDCIKQIARERASEVLFESKITNAFASSQIADVLLEGECMSEADIFSDKAKDKLLADSSAESEEEKIDKLIEMLPEDDADDELISQIVNAENDEDIANILESGLSYTGGTMDRIFA